MKITQEHVKIHIVQRDERKKYSSITQQDLKDKKLLGESAVTLIMDMSQNGTIPSLSYDQYKDFYYMSPLTQFIFGVCNNVTRSWTCTFEMKVP